jgi:hypothetical protein
MMHVFPACENLIRTLPALPHARVGNPEDVDSDAEDHAYDAASYLLVNLGGGADQWINWARKKAEAADGAEPPADEPAALPSPEPPVSPEEARKRLRDAAFRDQRFMVTSG